MSLPVDTMPVAAYPDQGHKLVALSASPHRDVSPTPHPRRSSHSLSAIFLEIRKVNECCFLFLVKFHMRFGR